MNKVDREEKVRKSGERERWASDGIRDEKEHLVLVDIFIARPKKKIPIWK